MSIPKNRFNLAISNKAGDEPRVVVSSDDIQDISNERVMFVELNALMAHIHFIWYENDVLRLSKTLSFGRTSERLSFISTMINLVTQYEKARMAGQHVQVEELLASLTKPVGKEPSLEETVARAALGRLDHFTSSNMLESPKIEDYPPPPGVEYPKLSFQMNGVGHEVDFGKFTLIDEYDTIGSVSIRYDGQRYLIVRCADYRQVGSDTLIVKINVGRPDPEKYPWAPEYETHHTSTVECKGRSPRLTAENASIKYAELLYRSLIVQITNHINEVCQWGGSSK